MTEERLGDERQTDGHLTRSVLVETVHGERVPAEIELARREQRDSESATDLLAHIRAEHEPRVA